MMLSAGSFYEESTDTLAEDKMKKWTGHQN